MISNNDREIIELVSRYIGDSNSKYAILIDGEWGCGKTYFVKEHLIPKINGTKLPPSINGTSKKALEYKSIYLSLYGIKSTSDISSQIYVSILSSPFEDKVSNGLSTVSRTDLIRYGLS